MSSVPLISSSPPTSSLQSFPIFFLLVLQKIGQKYKLHIWLLYTWKLRRTSVWLKGWDRKSEQPHSEPQTPNPATSGCNPLDWTLFQCVILPFSLQPSLCNALPFSGCWIAVDSLTISSTCIKLVLCLPQILFHPLHIWEYHRRLFIWS